MNSAIPCPAAIAKAVEQAMRSPCSKSHRGVAITRNGDGDVVGYGHNHPPCGRECAGDDACREACGRLCIHAEADALRKVVTSGGGLELVHIKVVGGVMIPGGGPSCWQCARDLLEDGRVAAVWLLHDTGWCRYPIAEFYELTMQDQGLPVLPTRPQR